MTETLDHTPSSAQAASHTVSASEHTPSDGQGTPEGAIEAVLLFADRAVPAEKLASAVGMVDDASAAQTTKLTEAIGAELETRIQSLNEIYRATNRAFRIERVAGGYRLMTLSAYARHIVAYQNHRVQNRLSKPAIETLAIIAYRQPITRAQIECIRGVGCGEVLKTLMDHRLITIRGRAEELGRPILYGTTKHFLEAFGLATLKDLPAMAEFGAEHGQTDDDE